MTPRPLPERTQQQLSQQLGYLSRSSQLFDLGYADEAIRIATSLRVLFHDRRNDRVDQGSIIKLLGMPTVNLVSTCSGLAPGSAAFAYDGYLHLPGNIKPWSEYLARSTLVLRVPEWWSQVIFVVNGKHVTRKDLVLWAAEKDGGAHADSRNDPTYDAIMDMWVAAPWPVQESPAASIPPQHLFALRRFALEVLASTELKALACPNARNHRPETHILYSFEPGSDPVANRALDLAAYYLKNKALKDSGERRDIVTIERSLELLHELVGPFQTWLGEEHIHLKDFISAERDFRAALTSQPNNHYALYGLGFCLREIGRHDESEEALLQAVSGCPDHVPSRLALANLYLKIDRFFDAIREYDSILTTDPANESARTNRDAAVEQLAKAKHTDREDKTV